MLPRARKLNSYCNKHKICAQLHKFTQSKVLLNTFSFISLHFFHFLSFLWDQTESLGTLKVTWQVHTAPVLSLNGLIRSWLTKQPIESHMIAQGTLHGVPKPMGPWGTIQDHWGAIWYLPKRYGLRQSLLCSLRYS